MNITEISFGRTIQIADYESAKLNLTASVSPGEDWRKVLANLKAIVLTEERAIRKAGTSEDQPPPTRKWLKKVFNDIGLPSEDETF